MPGYLLEGARAPLTTTDAIIVISGDGDLARFREGLRLFESGWAPRLIFSGAALEDEPSNAEVMRDLAVEAGVPPSAILLDHQASNTHGNALGTRDLMTDHGLSSAILVTSPYHLNRASITFRAVFSEAGLHVVPWPAPDQSWRKANWWRSAETRSLTFVELEKLGYIAITGRYS
ncbi:MAG: YdcF family protein [Chloroflexota bacterium]